MVAGDQKTTKRKMRFSERWETRWIAIDFSRRLFLWLSNGVSCPKPTEHFEIDRDQLRSGSVFASIYSGRRSDIGSGFCEFPCSRPSSRSPK